MLFRVFRTRSPHRWTVLIDNQPYGDYLDKDRAVTDAIEAAIEARQRGGAAEVWEGANRLY